MLSYWFEKKQNRDITVSATGLFGPKVPRHSGGWAALRKRLLAEPGLRLLDSGYTSPANINYLTSLGHSVFLTDLVFDACTGNWQMGIDENGNPVWNVEGFLHNPSTLPGAASIWCCCGRLSITCPSRWWSR